MDMDELLKSILAARTAPQPGHGPGAHGIQKPKDDPTLPAEKRAEIHSAYVGLLTDHMPQLDDAEKMIVRAEIQRVLTEGGF